MSLNLLNKSIEKLGIKEVSKQLGVSIGTTKRWIGLKSIPSSYQFEIMKINNVKIDYSKFDFKEKDQFFTPTKTAKYCFSVFKKILANYEENANDYIFIEPSAGNGSFLNVLPSSTIALDIEPKHERIKKQDYLTWSPKNKNKKYIVFGNPPFGLRGHLALKFINHSYDFADYVGFILPQLFESDGKGVPRKRVKGYNLIHSEKLNTNFNDPTGNKIKINCIFQVWSKYHDIDKYKLGNTKKNDVLKVFSLSDGGTPSTTRNKNMWYECDVYLPSTCYGKENMKYYLSFDDLPKRKGYGIVFIKNKKENMIKFKSIDWSKVAFLSTNSALNIRTSQIEKMFI